MLGPAYWEEVAQREGKKIDTSSPKPKPKPSVPSPVQYNPPAVAPAAAAMPTWLQQYNQRQSDYRNQRTVKEASRKGPRATTSSQPPQTPQTLQGLAQERGTNLFYPGGIPLQQIAESRPSGIADWARQFGYQSLYPATPPAGDGGGLLAQLQQHQPNVGLTSANRENYSRRAAAAALQDYFRKYGEYGYYAPDQPSASELAMLQWYQAHATRTESPLAADNTPTGGGGSGSYYPYYYGGGGGNYSFPAPTPNIPQWLYGLVSWRYRRG